MATNPYDPDDNGTWKLERAKRATLEVILNLQKSFAESGRTCDHGGPRLPYLTYIGDYPICGQCGGHLKPDFGEVLTIPMSVFWVAWVLVRERLKKWWMDRRPVKLVGGLVPWRKV